MLPPIHPDFILTELGTGYQVTHADMPDWDVGVRETDYGIAVHSKQFLGHDYLILPPEEVGITLSLLATQEFLDRMFKLTTALGITDHDGDVWHRFEPLRPLSQDDPVKPEGKRLQGVMDFSPNPRLPNRFSLTSGNGLTLRTPYASFYYGSGSGPFTYFPETSHTIRKILDIQERVLQYAFAFLQSPKLKLKYHQGRLALTEGRTQLYIDLGGDWSLWDSTEDQDVRVPGDAFRPLNAPTLHYPKLSAKKAKSRTFDLFLLPDTAGEFYGALATTLFRVTNCRSIETLEPCVRRIHKYLNTSQLKSNLEWCALKTATRKSHMSQLRAPTIQEIMDSELDLV